MYSKWFGLPCQNFLHLIRIPRNGVLAHPNGCIFCVVCLLVRNVFLYTWIESNILWLHKYFWGADEQTIGCSFQSGSPGIVVDEKVFHGLWVATIKRVHTAWCESEGNDDPSRIQDFWRRLPNNGKRPYALRTKANFRTRAHGACLQLLFIIEWGLGPFLRMERWKAHKHRVYPKSLALIC